MGGIEEAGVWAAHEIYSVHKLAAAIMLTPPFRSAATTIFGSASLTASEHSGYWAQLDTTRRQACD